MGPQPRPSPDATWGLPFDPVKRFPPCPRKTFRSKPLAARFSPRGFLSFHADDWNRSERGDWVYPSDMKHSIEDQTGKGYAGEVGTGC